MSLTVDGCRDCPFCYDDSDGQTDLYCHHPNHPWEVGYFEDAKWFSVDLPEAQKEKLIRLSNSGIRLEPNILGEEYAHLVPFAWWVHPKTFAPIHYRGDEYHKYFEGKYNSVPITPEWCPLKKGSLTIHYR